MNEQYRPILILILALMALIIGFSFSCRLGVRPDCPFGTYPKKVSAKRTVNGSADVNVTVPVASGGGGSKWFGSGDTDWECALVCPNGTAPEMEKSKDLKKLKCKPYKSPCGELNGRADGGAASDAPTPDAAADLQIPPD